MVEFLVQNMNQLNTTMQIMQTNIASNDWTLKAINQTLQYVVKSPMVIFVPSSDEISDHRSEFSKMQHTSAVQLANKTLRSVYLTSKTFFVENRNVQMSNQKNAFVCSKYFF